jgi:hypothetical protein
MIISASPIGIINYADSDIRANVTNGIKYAFITNKMYFFLLNLKDWLSRNAIIMMFVTENKNVSYLFQLIQSNRLLKTFC